MAEVVAFKSLWHWRIAVQLEVEDVGKTYAAYAGVLEPGEKHDAFRPVQWGGEGKLIPDDRKSKISYSQMKQHFSLESFSLDECGYYYRE